MPQQPLLGSPSGADAADPLQEESVSQAKTVYSDSDSGEDVSAEFPVGLLRCTPDKSAFSRTPSPNKDYHQARLLAQPTQLHTPSRAPRITGRSRQQRPQLARPADLGRHEGVGRRLVCGRTAAVRSPEGRAPARSHDGSDRASRLPSASPPRRWAPPSSPRIAATCPRACSTSATTRTTKSEPLPRPSRCAEGVCLCLGCRSECEILAKV